MADPRPTVDITYGEKGPPPPVADLTRTGAVLGPCSAGPLETLTTLTTEADLAPFGFGPGVVAAAEQLALGGAPQFFTRTKSTTAGSSAAAVKMPGPGAVGTAVDIGAANSGVRYLAKVLGATIQQINPGAVTASTTVAVNVKAIAVTLKHDGAAITATGDEVRAAVANSAAAMALLASVANVGNGSGLAVAGGPTALPFGSAGTLSVTTGAAFDAHDILIQVLRAGTVGTQPYPTFRWSADGGDADYKKSVSDTTVGGSWSGEQTIPATGILALKDLTLDTGVVVTLSGALEVGDTWRIVTTAPTTSQADVAVALAQALSDLTRQFSFTHVAVASDLAAATAYDATLQSAAGFPLYRGLRAFLGVRDQASNETEDAWGNAIVGDFDGATPFVSAQGRIVLCPGHARHYSARTGRYFWRSLSFAAAARRAQRAVHEDLGKVGSPPRPIANVVQLRHDEALKLLFAGHRMTSAMTHSGVGIFFTKTLALAAQGSRYGRQPIGAVMDQVALIARQAGLGYLLDTEVADETGAIAIEVANSIEDVIAAQIATYLYKRKEDGKVSASPVPSGEKLVTVARDYNFAQLNELRLTINVWHVGYNDKVSIDLNVVTAGS